MNYKIIIACLILIVVSLNMVSANEITNNTYLESLDNQDGDLIIDSINQPIQEVNLENSFEEEDSYILYVGINKTDDGGNGSIENPYGSLELASNNIHGENKVQLNIYDGIYYVGADLKFNTSNLYINAINNNVVLKNLYNAGGYNQYIGLTSVNANCTISNIIFDASDYTINGFIQGNPTAVANTFFAPFYGGANLVVFNNCSFNGFTKTLLTGNEFNSKFIGCHFSNFNPSGMFFMNQFNNGLTFTKFEYCIFSFNSLRNLQKIYLHTNISFEKCWFGKNELPTWIISPRSGTVLDDNGKVYKGKDYQVPHGDYAIFSVSENYLGNNQFEIVGKLTWNGTEDQDGMENFQPMTVRLSSVTGNISETAILTNGTFKAIYTSNSSEHKVVATLDNQPIELNFESIDFTVDAPSIFYGEDQNVTVTFPQVIANNITITVNNKTYDVEVNNSNSTTYTIEDILTEGNYTVTVIYIDEVNKVYGSNSTILTVSKVNNYVFDVVPSSEVKVGENATIDITLPGDVEGNVTIKFGNDTKILPANQTMVVNFNNLNATTYPVTVTYTGSDKYIGKEKVDSITVDKADSSVSVDDSVFTYGDVIVIPFNATNASGVNVRVLNKDGVEVANTTSKGAEFALDTLPAGKYTLKVTTIVNDNYDEFSADNINLTINKAESDLTLNDSYEFTYGENAVINVITENSTGDVIVSLDGFTPNVSGNAITLPKLNVGKYTLNVTTNPDGNHNNVTKSTTVTIIKAVPSMNAIVEPVENITTKDDVTLTISLPSDATGEVTVKINGKKTDTISANETITINLNNQAGDYVVDITYSGDKNYESDMTTKEYTVSKAETSITANPIIFEEGNTSTIEVNIPDVDSGFILVDVEGKKFYGDINNSKATVLIDGLVAGNYTANIIFAGDEKFNRTTGTVVVNVTPTVDIISELNEIIKELNSTIGSQAKEIDSLNATVNNQSSTIESQAKEIDSLNATVNNQSSTIESQKEQIGNLNKQINKKDVVLVVDQTFTRAAVDYNAGERGGMFYAILKDNEGNVLVNKTVQIAINGKIYNKTTDEQGRAGIQVNFANANTYSYAVSFQGDDTYNAAPIASSKLTVTKKKTTIKASNKVFKAKTKTKKISVTLKTVKNKYDKKTYLKSGKKVTLKVNGKTYTAKINKKGVAKFTIKIIKKGKYTAKIKFAGDKTYKASSKTIKIRIK